MVPNELVNFFKNHLKVALAFSGGVDSAYLLYAAKTCNADIHAYYVNTQFQPEFELDDAKRLADELSVPMTVITLDVLQNITVKANPMNRCYYCKREIFSQILESASADGYFMVLDGTNASDDATDRPGMRALMELEVHSPLRECGLTKQQIREFSKCVGLFTWDKPAYACLATRIETGVEIDVTTLNKIEKSEDILRGMGFIDFRVRVIDSNAKLQLPVSQFELVIKRREEIMSAFKDFFTDVLLDLNPR